MPVQSERRPGPNHQAYLWQYGEPGGSTVFDFRLGRGREGPKKFLVGTKEFYKPTVIWPTKYRRTEDGACGCWAHARRKFVDALK